MVATYYYDVLKAKKALEIAAANVERLTQYRNSAAKKVKVGELTKTSLYGPMGNYQGLVQIICVQPMLWCWPVPP